MFALLFLSSGFQKLVNYDFENGGGGLTRLVETKMDIFNSSLKTQTGFAIPLKTVTVFRDVKKIRS